MATPVSSGFSAERWEIIDEEDVKQAKQGTEAEKTAKVNQKVGSVYNYVLQPLGFAVAFTSLSVPAGVACVVTTALFKEQAVATISKCITCWQNWPTQVG